jgi:hypothetical protein
MEYGCLLLIWTTIYLFICTCQDIMVIPTKVPIMVEMDQEITQKIFVWPSIDMTSEMGGL